MIEEKEDYSLPWWTEEEIEAEVKAHPINPYGYDITRSEGYIGVNDRYFREYPIMDRYRKAKFVSIGYDSDTKQDYLRFLSTNPKEGALSRVNFKVKIGDDNDGGGLILKVDPESWNNVPPRERSFWQQHEIIPSSQVDAAK